MAVNNEIEIREELRWTFVIWRFNKPWSEHKTRQEAEAAIVNIVHNEAWMREGTSK